MTDWIAIEDQIPEVNQAVRYYAPPVGEWDGWYFGESIDGLHCFGSKEGGWLCGDVTHWKLRDD